MINELSFCQMYRKHNDDEHFNVNNYIDMMDMLLYINVCGRIDNSTSLAQLSFSSGSY